MKCNLAIRKSQWRCDDGPPFTHHVKTEGMTESRKTMTPLRVFGSWGKPGKYYAGWIPTGSNISSGNQPKELRTSNVVASRCPKQASIADLRKRVLRISKVKVHIQVKSLLGILSKVNFLFTFFQKMLY
jgi:hypothetical protein